ncbi:cyclophilin [Candidatus Saccharibacteria bacterium]|nr:cyclophilin [Candidatus Saccharibacteria bacterium]
MMNNKSLDVDPNLNQDAVSVEENKELKMDRMYIEMNGEKLTVDLEENATASALIGLLPFTVSMDDLNGNEKYVYLDKSLPVDAYNPGRIEVGDLMLYGDNCLVIFYESFDTEYSYTKIGHVEKLPEMRDGEVVVRFAEE